MIDETARDIRNMRTHSSSVVAAKAAEALGSLADREYQSIGDLKHTIEQNSRILRQANPSHAWLQSSQRSIVETVENLDARSVNEVAEELSHAVSKTITNIETATDQAGQNGLSLINNGDVLLTHDFSTTVLALAKQCATEGMEINIYVTEARPRYMGRRMARELSALSGTSVTLIVDSAAGHVMPRCDRVIVGMDCIVKDVLYNRIGTYPIATTAQRESVPVTVLGAAAKVIDHEFAFNNTPRDAVEVMREPTTAFEIENHPYDATPLSLIDTVVTEEEVVSVEATI